MFIFSFKLYILSFRLYIFILSYLGAYWLAMEVFYKSTTDDHPLVGTSIKMLVPINKLVKKGIKSYLHSATFAYEMTKADARYN